jgi:C4-dicarboxylate transporter DctM subunit
MLILLVASFFLLLIAGFPIAMAMGISSMIGLIVDTGIPSLVMAQKIFTASDSFALMAVPFFMLAGQIMEKTGITDELVNFANKLIGHLRGGLAYTVTLSGILMAGISGSANADASAIAAITLPAMKKAGYSGGFSVSVISAAGGLGPIIPPSIAMIIYANLTNMSIGKLFLAGYAPGILMGLGYMFISGIYARRHNIPKTKFQGVRSVLVAFKTAVWALIMPVIIIGGILTGVFTATESGVIAVFYGILYGFITRKLDLKKLKDCLFKSVVISAGPMSIIIMANLLGYLLTRQNLSVILAQMIIPISTNPVVFYFIIMITLLIAGMFLDGMAIMLILIPVLLPMIPVLGLDPMHFAMVFLLSLLTGGLTPPVGALLLIVSSIGEVPLKECIKPILPFIGMMLACIVLIIYFPSIVTFLPGLVQ